MRSTGVLVTALLFGAVVPGIGPLAAQSFDERIEVTEIEIPVRVVRNGEPLRGLETRDFEVLLDGRPMEIVGFSVLEASRPPGTPDVATAAADAEGQADPTASVVVRPRHLLVFFDFVFTERGFLRRAIDGVRTMLAEQIHPQDRVAVAYLSASGAHVLVGFTRDREETGLGIDLVESLLFGRGQDVQLATERFRDHLSTRQGEAELAFLSERFGTPAALALGSDLAGVLSGTRGSTNRFEDADAEPVGADPVRDAVIRSSPEQIAEEMESQSLSSLIRLLAHEMTRLATVLQDVPGPKEILYVAEGFPSDVIQTFDSRFRAAALRQMETMHESLIRGGWILHGIDAEGVPSSAVDVTEASPPPAGPSGASSFTRDGFDAQALFFMANETGGQVVENYNRIDQATERLLELTRVTYLLTVRADGIPADGARREIEVRLLDAPRGTRIHHRPAYYAPKPAENLDDLERELLQVRRLLGTEQHDGLGLVGHAGLLQPTAGSEAIHFVLRLPPERVEPTGNAGIELLQIRVFALDAGGGALSSWSRRIRLDLHEVGERLADGGVWLRGTIEVPDAVHHLRVLVESSARRDSSLLTLPLGQNWDPPPPEPDGLVLNAG